MPPEPIFDVFALDTDNVVADREAIYSVNPHRHEFQFLDRIFHLDPDTGSIAGYRDVGADEFWVRGHIPGRPIFPGVLMIETAAQLSSYLVMTQMPQKGFLGFGGVDDVKFRGIVTPGKRVIMICRCLKMRPRRCISATQAFVDQQLVYEGTITGLWI